MLQDVLRICARDRSTLLREGAGLAALCLAILAGLYLPVLV
jgi:hypothetical protein